MSIRLKGSLHPELTVLGLKEGDTFQATYGKNGAAYFEVHYLSRTINCVVWPENYDIIDDEQVHGN